MGQIQDESVIKQTGQQGKIKGVCDVVFCIDNSGSMAPVIDGLKEHISKFIEGLESGQQLSDLDYRLGFVAYDRSYFYKLDFTKDISKFKSALMSFDTGGDEFTLPALDYSLDFDWREATRIVITITDEVVDTGHDPDFQRSKFEELKKKIDNLHVHLYFLGPRCSEYSDFKRVARSYVNLFEPYDNVNESYEKHMFESYDYKDFEDMFETMGKTLSKSLQNKTSVENKNKNLYNVESIVNIVNL